MRSWTGCITCRTRKVKCDETRPTCNNCRKTQVKCDPCEPVLFKHWRNPSENEDQVWVSINPNYRFIDETDDIAAEYVDIPSQTIQQVDGGGENSSSVSRQSFILPHQCPPQETASSETSFENDDSINKPEHAHHPHSLELEEITSHDHIHAYNSSAITNEGAQALLSMRHASPTAFLPTSTSFPSPITPDAFHTPQALTSVEDAKLLRRFSVEVGRWMDLSDLSMTFSKKICQLATQDPLLKAAAIACAAKQLYLTEKRESDAVIAGKNYNTVISLLICRLGKSEQPYVSHGFAATVMCSCYEMMEASGSDWQKHLEGVFTLSKVRRINGSCGGIEQAGFWSIARQEVVCSVMNRRVLRLDPSLWTVDLENIGTEGKEDLINNQVLTILAKVVNYTINPEIVSSLTSEEAMSAEWEKLLTLLKHWKQSVKGFMSPVSVCKEDGKPFTTIWFARSVCASSWQMYHLAHILLLPMNPYQDRNCLIAFRAIEDDLLYHARQICGIAQSKPHGSCRVNSVQPLYYAGCCFNDPHEREAAAKLLDDIEDDLGWAAKYRARDLRRQHGAVNIN